MIWYFFPGIIQFPTTPLNYNVPDGQYWFIRGLFYVYGQRQQETLYPYVKYLNEVK